MNVNIFKRFIWSLYEFKNIATFRFEKIRKSILYLFTLMLILAIPYAVIMAVDSQHAVNQLNNSEYVESLNFNYEGDSLTFNDHEELYEDDDISIAITQEGFENASNSIILYLQENEATLITERNHYSFLYDDVLTNGDFNLLELVQGLDQFILTLIFVSSFIYLILSIVIKLAEVSLLALAGLVGIKSINRQATYSEVWKLSVYVVTLPTLIVSLIQWTGFQQDISGIIFWLGSFIILYMVLKNIPQQKEQ
ncbi:DUF1189 family protein [Alkalibacillus silvisoli]|uniref:DUF1189 domain-containing protein n=1 Tax=Alkalibacillus silvisoli TaxID=392823 RepID=A0ABP3JLS5_9BACI